MVSPTADGWRMEIPAGPRGGYRLAQLDDYGRAVTYHYMHLPRRAFYWNPPLTPREPRGVALSLRARASDSNLPGTWGFGLWNDPFGFAIGFGGTARRLPALPNTAWFFHASPENHLSLQEAQLRHLHPVRLHLRRCKRAGSPPGRDGLPQVQASNPLAGRENAQGDGSRQVIPANGFFAGTFRSPRWSSLLLAPGLLALPLLALRPVSRLLRRLASQIVCQDAAAVRVDVTQWHEYTLSWLCEAARFEVDGKVILTTPLAPHGPLGLVIWIDNQYAAWRPDGSLGYGTLENPAAWLEISDLDML
jgi:hypothetical protein